MKKISFDDLGLSDETLRSVKKKGFLVPSEIQEKIIPKVLENKHDIIGVSHTGSGKTASFALPIIDMINSDGKSPKVIILAPTRELALQVSLEIENFSLKRFKVLTVYGGASINNQMRDLKRGVDIVVGTPGRVLDLIERRSLHLEKIEYFVLDEADEMLKMGFIDDIEYIFDLTPKNRRVLLFSATMPDKIKKLSKKYMNNQIIVEVENKHESKANIKQEYFILRREEKFDAICSIIDFESFFYGIVFCQTKADVEEVTSKLQKAGYDADCIHGDIAQNKREKILKKFRDLKINILVATDVAARGIDVENLTHVINHSVPKETETYVHRIGRTGRAGKSGIAISFFSPKQKFLIKEIEKVTKSKMIMGKLADESQIFQKKKEAMKNEIKDLVAKNKSEDFLEISYDLIDEFGAENVINSLLAKIYMKAKKTEKDKEKMVRLFIAKGKDNNFGKRELFNFLEKESRIKIDGESVKINGKFSFMNVPSSQAEVILNAFSKRRGRPIVEKAEERKD